MKLTFILSVGQDALKNKNINIITSNIFDKLKYLQFLKKWSPSNQKYNLSRSLQLDGRLLSLSLLTIEDWRNRKQAHSGEGLAAIYKDVLISIVKNQISN